MSVTPKPQRIPHLDLFRAVAILAVVTIHATSQPVALLPKSTWQYNFYHFCNSINAFAVPSFLFFCALVLLYNYSNKNRETSWIWGFYRKRLMYILLPYILWSLIYFVIKSLRAPKSLIEDLPLFWERLLSGTNHAHLYFFTIIIQLYVLFPALLWFTRIAWVRRFMLPLGILFHITFYYFNTNYWHISRTGSLLPNYWIHITFGAWIGLQFEVVMSFLQRHKLLIGVIGMTSALTFIYVYDLNLGSYNRVYHFFIYNLYTVVASVCILLLSLVLFNWQRADRLKRFMNSIGYESFGIFLIHPLALTVWRKLVMPHIFNFHVGIWFGGAFALIIAWLITLGIRRFAIGWVLIGK